MTSKLYLMRHAHAEDIGPDGRDESRRLTAEGIAAAQAAGAVLARLDITPLTILSSPRERARHTAEIVAAALGSDYHVSQAVNYSFGLDAVDLALNDHPGEGDLLFVGHEPTLSQTLQALTGGYVVMKKAAVARVDLLSRRPLRGGLAWMIPPRVFHALNGAP